MSVSESRPLANWLSPRKTTLMVSSSHSVVWTVEASPAISGSESSSLVSITSPAGTCLISGSLPSLSAVPVVSADEADTAEAASAGVACDASSRADGADVSEPPSSSSCTSSPPCPEVSLYDEPDRRPAKKAMNHSTTQATRTTIRNITDFCLSDIAAPYLLNAVPCRHPDVWLTYHPYRSDSAPRCL